jgi:hypothetical protein
MGISLIVKYHDQLPFLLLAFTFKTTIESNVQQLHQKFASSEAEGLRGVAKIRVHKLLRTQDGFTFWITAVGSRIAIDTVGNVEEDTLSKKALVKWSTGFHWIYVTGAIGMYLLAIVLIPSLADYPVSFTTLSLLYWGILLIFVFLYGGFLGFSTYNYIRSIIFEAHA